MVEQGGSEESVVAFMAVRKTKKATNTEKAFELFMSSVNKSNMSLNQVLEICIQRDWKGFDPSWLNNQKPSYQPSTPQSRQTPSMADYMQREAMRDVTPEQQHFLEHEQ